MAEWLKAHDSKSCGLATVSEVRILSLPPSKLASATRPKGRTLPPWIGVSPVGKRRKDASYFLWYNWGIVVGAA